MLGALLADGWYRGQVGILRAADQWGEQTAFLAQLHLEHDDGTTTVLGTDASWRWSDSHIVAADLIEGQREDRRLVEQGWSTTGYDAAHWQPVAVSERGYDALVCSPAPPVRPVEEVRPVAVTELRPGVHLVDLGQNINGRVRLTNLGHAGTEITLTHGEALGPDGDVTMEHLRPAMPFLPEPLSAGQVDSVVSAGRDGRRVRAAVHHPRLPVRPDRGPPRPARPGRRHRGGRAHRPARARELRLRRRADQPAARRGGVELPRQRLRHPHRLPHPRARRLDRRLAALRADRDIPLRRGRLLREVAPRPRRRAVGGRHPHRDGADAGRRAQRLPAGPPTAPRAGATPRSWCRGRSTRSTATSRCSRRAGRRWWPGSTGSSGWPAEDRHPDRIARSAEPAAHERYLWDTGFHWGEWLEPGGEPQDFPAFIAADKSDVATAFYAWSTRHAARIAALLGRPADATRYAELSAAVVDAWRTEFLDADGRVTPYTQANLVRALRFDLVPDDLRQQAADDLADLVRKADTHLATGFLATPDLLPVLADHGHLDLAYELLFQDTEPSWLTMIDRGATTMWERWEGIDEDGVPHESLNHYSKGAVVSFLHRYVAGLQRVEPTWRRFRVQPRPGGGITRASRGARDPARDGVGRLAAGRAPGGHRDGAAGVRRRGGAARRHHRGRPGDARISADLGRSGVPV